MSSFVMSVRCATGIVRACRKTAMFCPETTEDAATEVAHARPVGYDVPVSFDAPVPRKLRTKPPLPVVPGLRPKQVHAAMMLVEGRMAKDVAAFLEVSPETVSRWRTQPAFQVLMHQLLQDSIDATKFGLVSLFADSIMQLRCLVNAIEDETALKAIALLFSKAGPMLTAINAEVHRPLTAAAPASRARKDRPHRDGA